MYFHILIVIDIQYQVKRSNNGGEQRRKPWRKTCEPRPGIARHGFQSHEKTFYAYYFSRLFLFLFSFRVTFTAASNK